MQTSLIQLHKSEYHALRNAINRCHNPENQAYHNYGARGITVAECWREQGGFDAFITHIGSKPSPELTLDRIDNELGYQPGNVRWATRSVQQSNRRRLPRKPARVRLVTINGVTKSIADWSRETGINGTTLWSRLANKYPEHMLLHKGDLRCGKKSPVG